MMMRLRETFAIMTGTGEVTGRLHAKGFAKGIVGATASYTSGSDKDGVDAELDRRE